MRNLRTVIPVHEGVWDLGLSTRSIPRSSAGPRGMPQLGGFHGDGEMLSWGRGLVPLRAAGDEALGSQHPAGAGKGGSRGRLPPAPLSKAALWGLLGGFGQRVRVTSCGGGSSPGLCSDAAATAEAARPFRLKSGPAMGRGEHLGLKPGVPGHRCEVSPLAVSFFRFHPWRKDGVVGSAGGAAWTETQRSEAFPGPCPAGCLRFGDAVQPLSSPVG